MKLVANIMSRIIGVFILLLGVGLWTYNSNTILAASLGIFFASLMRTAIYTIDGE